MQVESLSERHEAASGVTRDDGNARKNRRKGRATAESSAAALPERSNVAVNEMKESTEADWIAALPKIVPFHVVYFVRGVNGLVKVGTTHDLVKRLKGLRSMSATEIEVIAWCEGNERLELSIHAALDPYRHHGEWFRPCAELDDVIDRALEEGATTSPHFSLFLGQLEHVNNPCKPKQDGGCWCLEPKNRERLEAMRKERAAKSFTSDCPSCGQFLPAEHARRDDSKPQTAPSVESRPGPGVGSLSDASRPISCAVPSPTEAR